MIGTGFVLIGVDPGETTGLFAVSGEHLRPFVNDERNSLHVMCQLERLLSVGDPEVHIVCERYLQQSTKITPQYTALETIGVVKWLASKHGAELTLQSRSQKNVVTSFTLKEIGWWTSGTRGHVNDAARHALVWLATHHPNHPLVQRTVGMMAAG